MSLAQARKIRDEYLSLLAQKIDLKEHRQSLIDNVRLNRENTLRAVAEKWRSKNQMKYNLRRWRKTGQGWKIICLIDWVISLF